MSYHVYYARVSHRDPSPLCIPVPYRSIVNTDYREYVNCYISQVKSQFLVNLSLQ